MPTSVCLRVAAVVFLLLFFVYVRLCVWSLPLLGARWRMCSHGGMLARLAPFSSEWQQNGLILALLAVGLLHPLHSASSVSASLCAFFRHMNGISDDVYLMPS